MSTETSANNTDSGQFQYQGTAVSPGECLRALQTPIRFIKGIGPARAALLEGMGVKSVEDLLYHLPFRYEDRREILRIEEATVGCEGSFIGKLVALSWRSMRRRGGQILLGTLSDGTGNVSLVWFHPKPFIAKKLQRGRDYLVHGKVEAGRGLEKKIVHPEFETIEPDEEEGRGKVLPIYVRPGGIPLRSIRRWVKEALNSHCRFLPSFIPCPVARRHQIMDLGESLWEIHQPGGGSDIHFLNQFRSPAHHSIIFDEFFYLQLGLALQRKHRTAQQGIAFHSRDNSLNRRMRFLLPFDLTQAQERVLGEIVTDMESPRPMQRLVQGDVGSGKTILAWFAALKAIEEGYQVVLMAPTGLLAEQHFRSLKGFADALGISSALLIGSLRASERRTLKDKLGSGEIVFVVGTHALIQEGVIIPRMGLGIVDEQHRFGVAQRMALKGLATWRSSTAPSLPQPDILLMSATPIPRSLAMVLYGDMEVSALDEMPPGRMPVSTRVFGERERTVVYRLLHEAVQKGHQSYVVYPLVEGSDRLPLRDATGMARELSLGVLKDYRVGLVHGRMNTEEREEVMGRFKRGEIEILVSTTIIEVGIDVPNATTIVVEHAERFGLSQLHQLRGRVGRGTSPSQCLLLHYGGGREEARIRLKVIEEVQDGFRIAEEDLKLRGPGELLGVRQSGLPDFRLACLLRDSDLLFRARRAALDWLSEDPTLIRKESQAMKEILSHRWGERLELGSIG